MFIGVSLQRQKIEILLFASNGAVFMQSAQPNMYPSHIQIKQNETLEYQENMYLNNSIKFQQI